MATFSCLRTAPSQPLDLCSPVPNAASTGNKALAPTPRLPEPHPSCVSTEALAPQQQVTRHPAPLWPDFGMTEDIRLQPIEQEAMRVMKLDRPPCQLDIEHMFDMIPRSMLKRGDRGSTYVVGGASPRCRESLLTCSIDLPYFNFIVNKYIHWVAPAHLFTTFVLRRGAVDKPHRDTRNAPFPSLVQAFRTPCWDNDGLWVQDFMGTVMKTHLNEPVLGRVQPLRMPYIFDARRLLHAGHVHDEQRMLERFTLVAFCTLHTSTLSVAMQSRLYGLGFNVPTARECYLALHGCIPGSPPRLRQLSLHEFFQLEDSEAAPHDVIEVVHVHDSQSQHDE